MRLGAVGPTGRALADDGATLNQRGRENTVAALACPQPGLLDRRFHGGHIMPVHPADHVPAVGAEPGRGVVAEPVAHFTVDGNAIVVIKHDEARQPMRARK